MMLLASQTLLWLVVLVLAGTVLALARQIGVLHSRISPVGALAISRGPQPGETAPAVTATALSGKSVKVGGATTEPVLLFFVSPTCPICKTILPTVKSVAHADHFKLILVGDGDRKELMGMASRFDIPLDDFVNSIDIGRAFHVGKLPYGVLVDVNGAIAAQGLVNTREHVESLAEAHASGLHSVQDYLRSRDAEKLGDRGHPVAAR